jgi:hypothetical protein
MSRYVVEDRVEEEVERVGAPKEETEALLKALKANQLEASRTMVGGEEARAGDSTSRTLTGLAPTKQEGGTIEGGGEYDFVYIGSLAAAQYPIVLV